MSLLVVVAEKASVYIKKRTKGAMKISNVTILRREVEAITIPNGEKIKLYPGQEVLVTQNKGTNFTLNIMGNLVYLNGKDADAINQKPVSLPSDSSHVNEGEIINLSLLWDQLRTVHDPEIPVNIVDLGLIYDMSTIRLNNNNYHINIKMTLTAPGCGMGPVLMKEVKDKLEAFNNVDKTDVILVFNPVWNSEMMTEEAKLTLGLL